MRSAAASRCGCDQAGRLKKLPLVHFEVLGGIREAETIASGRGIRVYSLKGFALIRLPNGRVLDAELHWYEAHGIGKRMLKIKRYL